LAEVEAELERAASAEQVATQLLAAETDDRIRPVTRVCRDRSRA
jgi:hypothetical protein